MLLKSLCKRAVTLRCSDGACNGLQKAYGRLVKVLAGLDKHIYTSVVSRALSASSEESLMLVYNRLELVISVLAGIAHIGELTDEAHRLLCAGCEVINLVVCRVVDDILQVRLPEVIVNGVLHGVSVPYADIKLRGELMQRLELIICRKLGE